MLYDLRVGVLEVLRNLKNGNADVFQAGYFTLKLIYFVTILDMCTTTVNLKPNG